MSEIIDLASVSADTIRLRTTDWLENLYTYGKFHDNCKAFTDIVYKAREFDSMNGNHELETLVVELSQKIAAAFQMPVLWELPEEFKKHEIECKFPVDALPDVLKNYLKAVSTRNKSCCEMAALPLLSTLALCLQGKAKIQSAEVVGGEGFSEHLCLYTLTVSEPGTRKSSAINAFIKPIIDYTKDYNERNALKIEKNKELKSYLHRRREAAKQKKNAQEEVMQLTEQIYNLKDLHKLKMITSDTTNEALAVSMKINDERMSIMSGESGVFDTISGLYSNGKANYDLFINAYDGDYTSVDRKGQRKDGEIDEIILNMPLMTVGLMTQPVHFQESLAKNKALTGKGLIQRFLISFPVRDFDLLKQSTVPDVPYSVQAEFDDLIKRLLNIPYPGIIPVIKHSKESSLLFQDYSRDINNKMERLHGKRNEVEESFLGKQVGKALRIAGILHMCEHSASELLSGETAQTAINISIWSENERFKGFNEDYSDTPDEKNAKYILNRIIHTYKRQAQSSPDTSITTTYREMIQLCRAIHDSRDFETAVELLEDMKCLKVEEVKTKGKGRPKRQIIINPLLFL